MLFSAGVLPYSNGTYLMLFYFLLIRNVSIFGEIFRDRSYIRESALCFFGSLHVIISREHYPFFSFILRFSYLLCIGSFFIGVSHPEIVPGCERIIAINASSCIMKNVFRSQLFEKFQVIILYNCKFRNNIRCLVAGISGNVQLAAPDCNNKD